MKINDNINKIGVLLENIAKIDKNFNFNKDQVKSDIHHFNKILFDTYNIFKKNATDDEKVSMLLSLKDPYNNQLLDNNTAHMILKYQPSMIEFYDKLMFKRLSYYKDQNGGSTVRNNDFYKSNKFTQLINDLKTDKDLHENIDNLMVLLQGNDPKLENKTSNNKLFEQYSKIASGFITSSKKILGAVSDTAIKGAVKGTDVAIKTFITVDKVRSQVQSSVESTLNQVNTVNNQIVNTLVSLMNPDTIEWILFPAYRLEKLPVPMGIMFEIQLDIVEALCEMLDTLCHIYAPVMVTMIPLPTGKLLLQHILVNIFGVLLFFVVFSRKKFGIAYMISMELQPLINEFMNNYTSLLFTVNKKLDERVAPVLVSSDMIIDTIAELSEKAKNPDWNIDNVFQDVIMPKIRETPIWKEYKLDKLELLSNIAFGNMMNISGRATLPEMVNSQIPKQLGGNDPNLSDLDFNSISSNDELLQFSQQIIKNIDDQLSDLKNKIISSKEKFGENYPDYIAKIEDISSQSDNLSKSNKKQIEKLVESLDSELSKLIQERSDLVKITEENLAQIRNKEEEIKNLNSVIKEKIDKILEKNNHEIDLLEEKLESEIPIEILKLDEEETLKELENSLRESNNKINLLETKTIIKNRDPKKFQKKLDELDNYDSLPEVEKHSLVRDLELIYVEFIDPNEKISDSFKLLSYSTLNLNSIKATFTGKYLGKKEVNFNLDLPFSKKNEGPLSKLEVYEGELTFHDGGPSIYTGKLIVLPNNLLSEKISKSEKLDNSAIYVTGFGQSKIVWNKPNYKAEYQGDVLAGSLHGHGKLQFNNMIYTGEFQYGERNGEGILYDKKGNELDKGLWKDDKKIEL